MKVQVAWEIRSTSFLHASLVRSKASGTCLPSPKCSHKESSSSSSLFTQFNRVDQCHTWYNSPPLLINSTYKRICKEPSWRVPEQQKEMVCLILKSLNNTEIPSAWNFEWKPGNSRSTRIVLKDIYLSQKILCAPV